MAGFKASKVISGLDYDFHPFAKVKGVTPEPDDMQIGRYSKVMAELSLESGSGLDPTDHAAIAEFIANLDEDEYVELANKQAVATAELCSQMPNADELMSVPPRVRAAFYGYMQVQFSPEG
jgi:hypothetical protein